MYYLTLFIVFSIIGFLFENIVSVIFLWNYESGFLKGPWTPLYGFGLLILIFINYILKKFKLEKKKEIIIYYFLVTITLTLLELIGGHLIELVFNKTFWDYSDLMFNFGKYISLEVSIVWGLLATVVNYYIYPRLKLWLKSIPKYASIILFLIFLMDIIVTIIKSL